MHVRAGKDRQADRVGILLEGRSDDLLRRLAEAHVDDLHAGIAQRARDHFRTPIVPVEAWFRDDDSDFAHETAASFPLPASRFR